MDLALLANGEKNIILGIMLSANANKMQLTNRDRFATRHLANKVMQK